MRKVVSGSIITLQIVILDTDIDTQGQPLVDWLKRKGAMFSRAILADNPSVHSVYVRNESPNTVKDIFHA